MPRNLRRGLTRLYIVPTIGWALFCSVLISLKMQWDGKNDALSKYRDDVKMCNQFMADSLRKGYDPNCYQRIGDDYQNTLEFYSFAHFWVIDAAYWRLMILAVTLPPMFLFGADAIVHWIWRGFKSPSLTRVKTDLHETEPREK
jgi:hypothetical protein